MVLQKFALVQVIFVERVKNSSGDIVGKKLRTTFSIKIFISIFHAQKGSYQTRMFPVNAL